MKKLIFAALMLTIISGTTCAQEISPVVMELKGSTSKPAKGQFVVRNLSVLPLNVTLEPRSLDLKGNGQVILLPLDPKIVVRLSESSFRIPAKGERTVYFESACNGCVFSIYSSMVVGRTPSGLQVAVHLPETVYVCADTSKKCRARIRKEQFGLND